MQFSSRSIHLLGITEVIREGCNDITNNKDVEEFETNARQCNWGNCCDNETGDVVNRDRDKFFICANSHWVHFRGNRPGEHS